MSQQLPENARNAVSSPLALKILEAAYANARHAARWMIKGNNDRQCSELRERLRRSGLAELLAGGPGVLPDITAALPWPWKNWYRAFGPRSYPVLVKHVAEYLWWYLEPARPISTWRQSFLGILICCLLSWQLGFSGLSRFAFHSGAPLGGILMLLLMLSYVLANGFLAMMRHDQAIYAHELYNYLVDAYSDAAASPAQLEQHVATELLARRHAIAFQAGQPSGRACPRIDNSEMGKGVKETVQPARQRVRQP